MGKKAKYLVGQKFERLLVVDQYLKNINGSRRRTFCVCICDCQLNKENKKYYETDISGLLSGEIKSCGCYRSDMMKARKFTDYTGLVFDRLTVLKRIDSSEGNGICTTYLCQCSCPEGNKIIVKHGDLTLGRTRSCGCLRRELTIERMSGENSPSWKGGIRKTKVALYDTYAHQIEMFEPVRRCPEKVDLLEVQCYRCKQWMKPTDNQVRLRVAYYRGRNNSESHFYCSQDCKNQCSIFGQKMWPKGFKFRDNRPYIDPYWREQVLSNADYKCEICGSENDLNAHHIQSATLNPMLANDVDNGICCCSQCHYDIIHSQPGCTTYDLRCNPNSPE